MFRPKKKSWKITVKKKNTWQFIEKNKSCKVTVKKYKLET